MMYCVHCGTQVPDTARFCSRCGRSTTTDSGAGAAVANPPSASSAIPESDAERVALRVVQETSHGISNPTCIAPALAAVVSFIPGLGQILLGQTIKGIVVLIVGLLLAVLTGGLTVLVTWPLAAVDAYLIAKKLRAGRSVAQWEFF